MVGAAEYRANRPQQAIATLTNALSRLDLAAGNKSGELQLGRLLGETILAREYAGQSNGAALNKQLVSLQALIEKTESQSPQVQDGFPPWVVRFAVEMAKRALAMLSTSP